MPHVVDKLHYKYKKQLKFETNKIFIIKLSILYSIFF